MKKATVIGHFGFGYECLDGQTIKTKIITEALEYQFSEDKILKIDTHGGIKTLFKAPFQIFFALKKSSNVIILPAYKGLRINAPLLAFERLFFRKRKIHYIVIGGWLSKFLDKRHGLAKVLKMFDGIYVETNTMKQSLEAKGFKNVYLMPNCKYLEVLSPDDMLHMQEEPYKLCTFSRVMQEKGIEDAVQAVKSVNEKLGRMAYTLDIYGQIDKSQTEWFDNLKATFPDYIRYGGVVEYDRSVAVLKDYFALLFPTHYYTEGIPGTIIDAYAAGIPVISAKWQSYSDVIDENVTGIGYEFNNRNRLEEILETTINNPLIVLNMKINCLAKAQTFLPENVIKILVEQLK